MNLYKDGSGQIFAYDKDQVSAGMAADKKKLTAKEVEAHVGVAAKSLTRGDVDAARLRAYADPVTGSDRYKSEADAERLQGNEEAAKLAEQKLLKRREEIRNENPWPENSGE